MMWDSQDILAVLGMCGTCLVTSFAAGWKFGRMSINQRSITHNYNMNDHEPKLISATQKDSAIILDSSPLKQRTGTIMFWVFLNNKGEGIRNLKNNRYLFSCAFDYKEPYHQVVALAIGPKTYSSPQDRLWRLWIKGKNDIEKVWTCPDSLSLGQGWSHITVRWDFDRYNKMEVLVNGSVIITAETPHKYWPTEISPHLYFGTWASRNSIHYIETSLSRVLITNKWEENEEIKNERLNHRPEK